MAFLAAGEGAGAFAAVDAESFVLGVMGMVVFFFTSAPVVAPEWTAGLSDAHRAEQVRRLVAAVVDRVLAPRPPAVR